MSKLKKLEGIIPSVCVVYTDETCRTIDKDAYREHLRYLLKYDVGALVVGGHAGENECLNSKERKMVLKIVQEEVKGRVPIVGGVVADSTWEAIEKGLEAKEAGADAVLFCPPAIIGWHPETGGELLVEHYAKFDKEVNIPIVLFGGPTPIIASGTYFILPKTFKAIAQRVENVVACKITTQWDLGGVRATVSALKEVRDIGCLHAGSSNLFGALLYGADGNLSGDCAYRAEEDVQILKAIRNGDWKTAKAIADKITPVTDIVKGIPAGLSPTYFHYRYKVAAWLMGLIPRPHMRLPQVPPPLEEVKMLREALLKAGKPVVREAEQFAIASV